MLSAFILLLHLIVGGGLPAQRADEKTGGNVEVPYHAGRGLPPSPWLCVTGPEAKVRNRVPRAIVLRWYTLHEGCLVTEPVSGMESRVDPHQAKPRQSAPPAQGLPWVFPGLHEKEQTEEEMKEEPGGSRCARSHSCNPLISRQNR